jgi:hypothetical protein
MSFIEININHSFNKEPNDTDKEKIIGNDSTLNKNLGNNIEVNSINVASITNSAVSNQSGFTIGDIKRKTLIREILVGAMGSVIGSIITMILMNFFK